MEGQAQNGGRGPGVALAQASPTRAGAHPSSPGRQAGASRAAAVRTCSRSPEQLRAAVREARTQSTAGAEGGDPGGIRQLPSRRCWAEEATGSGVGGGETKAMTWRGGLAWSLDGASVGVDREKGAYFPELGTKRVAQGGGQTTGSSRKQKARCTEGATPSWGSLGIVQERFARDIRG